MDQEKDDAIPSFSERYRHKIKSVDELREIIGPRPRKKR